MKISNIFTILIFTIVSVFISLTFNSIESAYKVINENNSLHSSRAIEFQLSNADKIPNIDFFNNITKLNNITLEKEYENLSTYSGKAIYFNKNVVLPPLIRGRYFNKSDFNNNNKYIVIGKNLLDLIKVKENKEYISVNGYDYQVIGVMGNKAKSSIFDETFYISLDSSLSINNSKWIIDGQNPKDSYSILKSKLTSLSSNISMEQNEIDGLKSSFTSIIADRSYLLIIIALVIFTLLLNIVSTTNYYINRKKKEIGIRRAFGSTKLQIYKRILIDYQIIALGSFLISQIIYFTIIKIRLFPDALGENLMFKSTISSFFVILIIGVIVSLIPISKSNKFQPNEIMKGI